MKFKDLKIGDWFRMSNWAPGVIDEKIDPDANDGWTSKEVSTGICHGFVKDDSVVIKVKKEKTNE